MSRHLQYLNCLRAELKSRYGEEDDCVREVDSAIKTLEDVESRYRVSPALVTSAMHRQTIRNQLSDRPLR